MKSKTSKLTELLTYSPYLEVNINPPIDVDKICENLIDFKRK